MVADAKTDAAAWLKDNECAFYFVARQDVLAWDANKGWPAFQDLRREGKLVKLSVDMLSVIDYRHVGHKLAVSHRWEKKDCPDPTGAQVRALQQHLNECAAIEHVWVECADRPKRTTPTSALPGRD